MPDLMRKNVNSRSRPHLNERRNWTTVDSRKPIHTTVYLSSGIFYQELSSLVYNPCFLIVSEQDIDQRGTFNARFLFEYVRCESKRWGEKTDSFGLHMVKWFVQHPVYQFTSFLRSPQQAHSWEPVRNVAYWIRSFSKKCAKMPRFFAYK